MSKYQPLADRLAARAGPEWRASLADLEKALGFALPKAARARAWWKAGVWTDAGWTAELDPAAGAVTFRKPAAKKAPAKALPEQPAPKPPAVAADEPPILKRLEVGPGWGVALVLGGAAIVGGIGALVFRGLSRRKG
jgi:hypothetical protein